MAQINPSVPQTQDPNYLGYSHPIETPKPNTTVGEALKGVGESISTGLKAGDEIVKNFIDQEAWDKLSKERTAETNRLEGIKAAVAGGKAVDMNILGSPAQSVPPGVEEGLNAVGTLADARGNGKLPMTSYEGRLDTIASDLRSRYPGYREYIDKRVSEIVGMDPANAKVRSLYQDINSFLGNKNAEAEKIVTFAHQNYDQIPGLDKLVQGYRNSGYSSEWRAKIEGAIQDGLDVKAAANRLEAEVRFKEAQRTLTKLDIKDPAADVVTSMAVNKIYNEMTTSGLTIGKMADMHTNGIPLDSEGYQNQAQLTAVAQRDWETAAIRELQKKGVYNKLGPDGVNDALSGGRALFGLQMKAFTDKDVGLITAVPRLIQAQKDDATNKLLKTDFAKQGALITHAFSSLFGNSPVNDIAQQQIKQGFGTAIGEYVSQEFQKATLEAAKNKPDAKGGTEFAKELIKANITPLEQSQGMDQFLKHVQLLKEDKTPLSLKLAIGKMMFDPKETKFLSQFQMDTTIIDPVTKTERQVPGRYAVFATLAEPSFSKAIQNTGDPTLIKNYINWKETEFAKDLFQQDILNLRDISLSPYSKLTWKDIPGGLPRFELTVGPDVHGTLSKSGSVMASKVHMDWNQAQYAKSVINRVNYGIANMVDIPKMRGEDMSTYMFNLFKQTGLDLGEAYIPGIPKSMLDAIIASTGKTPGENLGTTTKPAPATKVIRRLPGFE